MNEPQQPDYLWDPAVPGNDDAAAAIRELERVLRPLRCSVAPAPERVLAVPCATPASPSRMRHRLTSRPAVLLLATAAALLLGWLVGDWLLGGSLRSDSQLRPGDTGRRFVAATEPLQIALGELVTVTMLADSELELLHWRDDEARFRLLRGQLAATVAPAPQGMPGFFVVEIEDAIVRSGAGIDRGGRFELVAGRDRDGAVTVLEGAVTFASRDREVLVPAGASAQVTVGVVETPLFADVSREVRQLVHSYDRQLRSGAPADERRKLADKLTAMARQPHDSLPLWHLLADDDNLVRKIVTEGLFRLAGAPDGGTTLLRVYTADEWLPHLRAAAWLGG